MTIKEVEQAIKSKIKDIVYKAQTENLGVCYQSHYDTLMFSIYDKNKKSVITIVENNMFIVDSSILPDNEELIAIKKYIIKELNKEFKCD